MKACLFLYTILFILILSISTCQGQKRFSTNGLRKIPHDEILDRVRKGQRITESTLFIDTTGMVMLLAQLSSLPKGKYFFDHFVDSTGEIKALVMRRATSEDLALMEKMEGLARALAEGEPVTLIDVDCSSIKSDLEEVFKNDQHGRSEGNFQHDKKNQQIVVSIIEKCGFPTIEKHGHTSVQAVFLVLQHAGKNLRLKYFPLIQKAVERGDLQASVVALMEDRMLMDDGKAQKYGTQVVKKFGSEKWELHPIEDAAKVNERRAAVGLEPIEDYLLRFDIVYKAK